MVLRASCRNWKRIVWGGGENEITKYRISGPKSRHECYTVNWFVGGEAGCNVIIEKLKFTSCQKVYCFEGVVSSMSEYT